MMNQHETVVDRPIHNLNLVGLSGLTRDSKDAAQKLWLDFEVGLEPTISDGNNRRD